MFGRQSRKHTQALEELREEFSAADRNARAVLADAMAQIELRMAREREDLDATRWSTESAIENTQTMLTTQAIDVGRILQQVADTCALIAEQVQADRSERRAFTEAIARLVQAQGAPLEAGERPLGGTVFPAPEILTPAEPDEIEHDIDVRAAAEPPAADDTIDLTTTEEEEASEPTSRPLPRWVTKHS